MSPQVPEPARGKGPLRHLTDPRQVPVLYAEPMPGHPPHRWKDTWRQFAQGLGQVGVALNGLFGQGVPPPPPPPPVHTWSAPPPPDDALSEAFQRAQQEFGGQSPDHTAPARAGGDDPTNRS